MRYFLDKNGAKTFRMQGQPGDGHYDIAREVLAQHGVAPTDYADHYDQMFRLKYARIVEHAGGLLEVEHGGSLTAAQRRFIRERESAGKQVKYVKLARPSQS